MIKLLRRDYKCLYCGEHRIENMFKALRHAQEHYKKEVDAIRKRETTS